MSSNNGNVQLSTKITSIYERILDISGVLAGVLIVAIMLAVSVDVVCRYFFYSPIVGVDEISATFLLYITFLSAAWLLRREGHIRIDILFNRLKPKAQARLDIITSVIGAILSLILVWYGTLATLDAWSRGVVYPTVLEIPRASSMVIIPVGGFLLFLQFLRRVRSRRTV